MALDDHTRRMRQRYLGSSDAAALCGKDPWRSPADVWLEKTGRVPSFAGNSATEIGQFLEPAILDWAEAHLQTRLTRDLFRVHPNEVQCANLDGAALGLDEPAIVEAKSAGMIARPRYFNDFGEADTDQVPEHILLQAHHQLCVVGAQEDLPPIRWVLVPALLVSRGFVLFRIPRNDDLCAALTEHEERFWRDYVVTNTAPPDAVPSLDTLKVLQRDPALTVPIDAALVQAWDLAKAAAKEAQAIEKVRLQAVLTALGDAEVGTCELGTLTYREQTRKGYAVEASTFRVARFTPMKKENAA